MKKFNKKKIIILTATLFIYIPLVFAAISYSSSDVVIETSTTTIKSTYLQDAIDEIDYVCSTNCPKGMTCKSNTPKCIRATTLHTETCTNSSTTSHCQKAGYALNDTITYGNITTTPGALSIGDAFDCDVNGDGTYDSATERFYYISDYYDTDRKKFNDKIAVLVYYTNTINGVASTSNAAYDCTALNNNGPVTGRDNLPKITQWNNIRLYRESRQILAQNGSKSTQNGQLPQSFSYSGYSARLLTFQEVLHSCFDFNLYNQNIFGSNCNFLYERTQFANSSVATDGSWLETPFSTTPNYAARWRAGLHNIQTSGSADCLTDRTNTVGIRPVIEILISEISY